MVLFNYLQHTLPFSRPSAALVNLYRAPNCRLAVTISKFPSPSQISAYELADLERLKLAREDSEFSWEAFITSTGKAYAKALVETPISELVDFSVKTPAQEEMGINGFYLFKSLASDITQLIKFATPKKLGSIEFPSHMTIEDWKLLGILVSPKKSKNKSVVLSSRGRELINCYLSQCEVGVLDLLQQAYWLGNKAFKNKNNLLTFIPRDCWSVYLPKLQAACGENFSSFYAEKLRKLKTQNSSQTV